MNQHPPPHSQEVAAFKRILEGVDLVIFDFDGVIADSEVISLTTLQASLKEFGLDLTLEQTRSEFLGTSLEYIASYVAKCGSRDAGDFPAHWEATLFEGFRAQLKPVRFLPDILELLCRLRVPYCIASSGTFRRIAVAMRAIRMESQFDHVFSAEQVTRGKPEPDLFEFAAKQMSVPPKACLVIEDSPFGVRAAKAAGMRCVGFTDGSHVKSVKSKHSDLLLETGADLVLSSYDGLAGKKLPE